jgi:hypothetical protein
MPPNTVKVDRTSQWGNPFVIGKVSPGKSVLGAGTPSELCGVPVRDRAQAIELFRKWIYSESNLAGEWRRSVRALRGKNLACWCPLGGPCHAEILLSLAN